MAETGEAAGEEVKAVTLRHPWAFAVQRLGKDIENRTWKPPHELIGQYIAIHGGAVPRGEALDTATNEVVWMLQNILTGAYLRALPADKFTWVRDNLLGKNIRQTEWITPGIVAVAKLEAVVTKSDSPWFFGPYGFVLSDVTPLDRAIPHRGALGFWDVEPHAERLVKNAISSAPHLAASVP